MWPYRLQVDDTDSLGRELAAEAALIEQVRTDLYSISSRYYRSLATTALAAAVAEWTYRVMDPLEDWQNETAVAWRNHLRRSGCTSRATSSSTTSCPQRWPSSWSAR
jgi:hypothetical protein